MKWLGPSPWGPELAAATEGGGDYGSWPPSQRHHPLVPAWASSHS